MDTKKSVKHIMEAIRERRVELGYSQDYMALKLGIAQNTYSKIEKNKVKLTVARLLEISKLLKVDPIDLVQQSTRLLMAV